MNAHLRRDIAQLEREILYIGSLVEDALAKATTAMFEGNVALCHEVIGGDSRINEKEVTVEEFCLKILALHQPVAVDLRFLVTALKVNNDLERMGDMAVNLAERVIHHEGKGGEELPEGFNGMVSRVRAMVRQCLDSLVRHDVAVARQVMNDDDEVDRFHRDLYRRMREQIAKKPDSFDAALDVLSMSRYLERIADLATNIAEDVLFMIEGEIIRHRFR